VNLFLVASVSETFSLQDAKAPSILATIEPESHGGRFADLSGDAGATYGKMSCRSAF